MFKIKSVKIEKLWGEKDYDLKFDQSVNFLIGPNGSGKTTIMNILTDALNGDLYKLSESFFEKITIDFFQNDKKETLSIRVTKSNKEVHYPELKYEIKYGSYKDESPKWITLYSDTEKKGARDIDPRFARKAGYPYRNRVYIERFVPGQLKFSWLSINRKSFLMGRNSPGDEDDSPIDKKLKEVTINLSGYFSSLKAQDQSKTQRFQRSVFESFLDSIESSEIDKKLKKINVEEEKNLLKQVFSNIENLNENNSEKIEAFYQRFDETIKLKNSTSRGNNNTLVIKLMTLRIHNIVTNWNKLLTERDEIYDLQGKFLSKLNNMWLGKKAEVNDRNELEIKTLKNKPLDPRFLSSGEKQLLIILSESLLAESSSHIYMADEPELSLHVEWQSKLVESLIDLNKNSQIIFATHSPDIVGSFGTRIIKIGESK
ncbi:AAA family ATPase [Flavobacterium filum]|uniref:AAA family ATPase n=1 Tax=Flavobacterium filum TaxID=370974 RepID=UPI0023F0FE6D|nr:AAA family ATPase [Flavobacterium filum]